MTQYENILKFIKPLEEYPDKLIKWHPGEVKKDKKGNNVLVMGYPIYSKDTINFKNAMMPFMIHHYDEVIESYGIKCSNIDINELDLSKYDDKFILAIITAIIRWERINEGLLETMIENGAMLKLLKRLKDFDKPINKEDTITKIDYSYSCWLDFSKNERLCIEIISKDKVRIEYSVFNMKENIEPVKILNKTQSKELIKRLTSLNLFDWEENYEPKEDIILDGDSWDLTIYTTILGTITKQGNNAYPNNWSEFKKFCRWVVGVLKR